MGWSYSFWAGTFYPSELKPNKYVREYSRHFNSVEIDNSFYRVPSPQTVQSWEEQVPSGFKFAAKFPRVITHQRMLRDCEQQAERFITTMFQLHSKLGPLLIQLPPTFTREHFPQLKNFLKALPSNHQYALEIRNKELENENVDSLLRETKTALVLKNPNSAVSMDVATSDFLYIRWEGDRRKIKGTLGKVEVDRTEELRASAEAVKTFLAHRLDVFGYFSKYYSGYPPADVEQLQNFLGVR
jgi:uncharacterized protein YecE (DUF72 family)